jgi:hypothetical protein
MTHNGTPPLHALAPEPIRNDTGASVRSSCSERRLAPVALAAVIAVAIAVPAGASAGAPQPARSAGSDVVVLTYPSLVRSRVGATRRALKRATQQLEDGQVARAVGRLAVVRSKLSASWRGARYVIRTTPPPVADEAWIRPSVQASGDGPTGPALAGPADTALLVLTLQHDVTAEMVDQLDEAPTGGVAALGATLRFALAQRDRALRDIRALAPPAPAQEDRAPRHARASGDGPVVATFETVMPQVIPQLDDELQAIDGLRSDATGLTPAARGYLGAAGTRIARTRATVKRLWPPIPAED